MLDGIKLLIERMDEHPEEFFGDLSFRWADIMQDIAKHGPEFLEEDDLMLLNRKVKEIRRRELNAKITEEIATQARLQVAQERYTKAPISRHGAAIAKGEGQKVWWSDGNNRAWISTEKADSLNKELRSLMDAKTMSGYNPTNTISGYDPNSENFFGRSILDMIERGKDNATLQNIRAQNAMLQEQLAETQAEIARRDEARKQSQAYKKRNNQNWK
jgi:hypothetical protein